MTDITVNLGVDDNIGVTGATIVEAIRKYNAAADVNRSVDSFATGGVIRSRQPRERNRKPERRSCFGHIEIRTQPDGKLGLHGYAAVFDSESYGETVKRSAFNRTLGQRDNVRLLVNHEGVPLASTGAGTMTLEVDDRGLVVDAPDLDPANPDVARLVSAMGRGDIDQMSFMGIFHDSPKVDGVRELREVELWDVSVVTFPWYEDTAVALKSARSVEGGTFTDDDRRAVGRAALTIRTAPAGTTSWSDRTMAVWDAIEAATESYVYVVDIGDGWAVYCSYADFDSLYQVDWSADDVGNVTTGAPVLVAATYVPAGDPAAASVPEPDVDDAGPVVEANGLSLATARAYALAGRVPPVLPV